MPDPNLTEIACVLDRSGSMGSIIDDAIGGFNAMLEEQQKIDKPATMTIVMFDHEMKVVTENVPIRDVKPFTRQTYVPRGSTALNDAIGSTIDSLGSRFTNLPEDKRPGQVLFVILTDGQENSSSHYRHERIAQMVRHQTEQYGWTFLYLSADLDAFAHAQRLHIPTSVRFCSTPDSVGATYDVISEATTQYRHGGARGMSISGQQVDTTDSTDSPNKAE
jgi:uncharacterized protein YegL